MTETARTVLVSELWEATPVFGYAFSGRAEHAATGTAPGAAHAYRLVEGTARSR